MDDPILPRDDPRYGSEEGLTIFLKVNYKVLLLVVVLADLFTTSLNEVVVRFFD